MSDEMIAQLKSQQDNLFERIGYLESKLADNHEQLTSLHGQVKTTDTFFSSTVKLGLIVDPVENKDSKPPEPEDPASPSPSVLVKIGDDKKYTLHWMPWLVSRAGYDSEWWMPQAGELVVILSPSGNLCQGIIIGSLYKNRKLNNPKSGDVITAIPVKDKHHIHSRIYHDGSRIDYDPIKHKLEFAVFDGEKNHLSSLILDAADKGTISIKPNAASACEFKLTGKNGAIALTGATIELTGDVTINGTLDVKEAT